VSVQSLLKS